jgi:predicted esterase
MPAPSNGGQASASNPAGGAMPSSAAAGAAATSGMPGAASGMPGVVPPGAAPASTPGAAAAAEPAPPAAAEPDPLTDVYVPWEPACPDGFTPQMGMNSGFPSDGAMRQFQISLPSDMSSARPVFLALTGTEQQETGFLSQSGLNSLTQSGWIVIVPFRSCSTNRTNCNGLGEELSGDGRTWEPWFDGSVEAEFAQDEGPDVRFFEAAVKCAATEWEIDQKRIYLGGISAGGTITNRNMTFNSGFYAGGVNASGMWFPVAGDWSPPPAGTQVDPLEGWCCPRPLHTMDSSIVISIYGGSSDRWSNGTTSADYGTETKVASQYYASQSKVVHVGCSGNHGHSWPSSATNWLVTTVLSHPKGTDPAAFTLPTPPSGLNCVIGEYTDH